MRRWHTAPLLLVLGCASRSTVPPANQPPPEEAEIYQGCGPPESIPGYEISFHDDLVSLPRYVRITRGETVLYSDDEPSGWERPYQTARFGLIGDFLLIVTTSTDCVDLESKRLFVVRDNAPLLHQDVWTGSWKDGYFLAEGRLSYWSEWFCHPENADRKAGMAYIYSLDASSDSFLRVDVPEADYCEPGREPILVPLVEMPLRAK